MANDRQPPTKHVSVRLPVGILLALDGLRLLHREDWTRSRHIREALAAYVAQHLEGADASPQD